MGQDLLHDLLDHPNPAGIVRQVQETLAREQEARAKFREWLRPDVKAEFINGEIIVHSPALRRHNQVVKYISFILEAYTSHFNLGEVAIEKALVQLERSDFEPDVCFWHTTTAATFTDDLMYYPPPNLVVEVLSNSTADRDRGVKYRSYEEAGVDEYWMVDPKLHTVEQFVLGPNKAEQLVLQQRAQLQLGETITSDVLPDFSVPVKAFFDLQVRGAVVQQLTGGH